MCQPDEGELQRNLAIAAAVAPCLLRRVVRTETALQAAEERAEIAERAKQIAEDRARHDGLTGLYNYEGFQTTLGKRLSRSPDINRRTEVIDVSSRSGAIIFGDIKKFKRINDETTHDAADEGLRTIAHIIAENIRDTDLVCRRSGDEFIVFISGPRAVTEAAFSRLQELLNERVAIEYHGRRYPVRLRMAMEHRDDIGDIDEILEMINVADAAVNQQRRHRRRRKGAKN